MTFVCNPNAPSGTFIAVDDLAALSEQVTGLLVIDEAYVDFAGDSALRLVRERPNVLVLRTLSKSFSLAGMRVGLACGAPPLIAELCKVKDSYNLSRVSIAAGAAALADYDVMRAHARRVCATRTRLSERCASAATRCRRARPTSSWPASRGAISAASTKRSSSAASWCATSPRRSCSTRCASRWAPTTRSTRCLKAMDEIGT